MICNVPYWFSSIWGVVARLVLCIVLVVCIRCDADESCDLCIYRVLPPSIRSKICIMSGVDGLAEFIAPEEVLYLDLSI